MQRRSRTLRRALVTGSLALAVPQASCYTYGAVHQGNVVPGTRMAFALTDRGRASLGSQVGPGVLQLEGTLLQTTGDAYVVSVAAVRSIDGGTRRWGGERVTIGHDDVANIRRRSLSKGRTTVAIATVLVGATVFALTRDLSVFGLGKRPPTDPPAPPVD